MFGGKTATVKRKIAKYTGRNRRHDSRLTPTSMPALKSVRLSQGDEAKVIDISRGGILLQTDACLRPQMKILLKLITGEGVFKIDAHILRSSICSLEKIPLYRTAIAFDHPLEIMDELLKVPAEISDENPSKSDNPEMLLDTSDSSFIQPNPDSDQYNENAATLIVTAKDGIFQEMCRLNDW
jgi:hypothetical protein